MSVRKKGNKWFCRFQIDGIRYERACKGATTQKDAEKCEAIIKAEIMHGNYNFGKTIKKVRLQDIIQVYLNYSKNNKRTYNKDLLFTKLFIDFWGNCEVEAITPSSIESYKIFLKEKRGNKNSTINRHLQALSKMFNTAIDNNLIDKNPLQKVKRLKEDNFKIRFLTKEEESRLFEALNYHYEITSRDKRKKEYYPFLHLKNIILCALQTGMRLREITDLKKHSVDIKTKYIEVLKTKSNKARKIPISDKLFPILQHEINNKNNKSEYVFINPETGTKYNDFKKSFYSLLKKAEINNFTFHDFRHTVATRLVEAGIDLVVVQEIMGHANIQTTMRYAHPVPERKLAAIKVLASCCAL